MCQQDTYSTLISVFPMSTGYPDVLPHLQLCGWKKKMVSLETHHEIQPKNKLVMFIKIFVFLS
jgi:hypothetical protein